MAKTTKTAKPAASGSAQDKPKAKTTAAKTKDGKSAAAKTHVPKSATLQKAAAKTKPAAAPKASAKASAKPAKSGLASAKQLARQTSDAISALASDILADRIVPTLEQIKSLAASALGQDQTKGTKSKAAGKSAAKKKS